MDAKQQSVNEVTQNNCLKCWDGRLKEYIYIEHVAHCNLIIFFVSRLFAL